MSNRIRICLNIYNINNNIYKDCYFFGEVLDPNKFLTKINILAEEAIEFMLLDKFDERTSKLLSFETSGIPMKQDFKLRKIRLPKSKMKDYIKLKKISQYSINGKTKRMIRYILNKEFGEKIDDKVHISECPSDDEDVDIYGFDKLMSEEQTDNKKGQETEMDVPIYTTSGKLITKEELTKQRNAIRELENDKAIIERQKNEYLQQEKLPIVEKTLTSEQLFSIMNQSLKLPDVELSIETPLTTQKSLESKDPEIEFNIKLLISIGFLKEGNFTIKGNKAILNKPCGFAYGDLLKGRSFKYKGYGGQGVFYGFSRLGINEIDKDLELIFF
jgi:hypothetical protein